MLRQVGEAGLEAEVTVDSAGTGSWHVGERADPRMRQAASRRELDLESRARQLTYEDLDRFDLVVAMDGDNRRAIEGLRPGGGSAEVVLLSSFLDGAGPDGSWPEDVPDPYYGGESGFDVVLDMLEAACPAVLDHLRSARGGSSTRR